MPTLEFKDFLAAVATLFAAWYGSYKAHQLAHANKNKEDLVAEFRESNRMAVAIFGLLSSLFAMKDQHVRPIKEQFDKDSNAIQGLYFLQQKRLLDRINYRPIYDFTFFSLPDSSFETALENVFRRLTISGHALVKANMLRVALRDLNKALEFRAELIREFQAKYSEVGIPPEIFFGLETERGRDQRYSTALEAIATQTNFAIHLAIRLGKDLQDHAKEIAKRLEKEHKEKIKPPDSFDFHIATLKGLVPDFRHYAFIEDMLKKQ